MYPPNHPIPKGWALCDGQHGTPDLRDTLITGQGIQAPTYTVPAEPCVAKPQMVFTELPSPPPFCTTSTAMDTATTMPAVTLIFRHCDRGYPDKPECRRIDPTICAGCEHASDQHCVSNICSDVGIDRAWGLGTWMNCFAQSKGLSIGGAITQPFPSTNGANNRPQTTATLAYESLQIDNSANLNTSFCVDLVDKLQFNDVKAALGNPLFQDQIVYITWDHKEMPELIKELTGTEGVWDRCCFDQVAVIIDGVTSYFNLDTFAGDDLCYDGPRACAASAEFTGCTNTQLGDPVACNRATLPNTPLSFIQKMTKQPTPKKKAINGYDDQGCGSCSGNGDQGCGSDGDHGCGGYCGGHSKGKQSSDRYGYNSCGGEAGNNKNRYGDNSYSGGHSEKGNNNLKNNYGDNSYSGNSKKGSNNNRYGYSYSGAHSSDNSHSNVVHITVS